MVNVDGRIQDLLTDMGDDIYVPAAHDHEEWTVIDNNDITILNDVEALWAAIVGVLKTPQGFIDGVNLQSYGSQLPELEGLPLDDWHIRELARVYIKNTIPQFQGFVLDFPKIEFNFPSDYSYDRMSVQIFITVDSIFGTFTRYFYL